MIKVSAETFSVVPRVGSEGRSLLHDKIHKVFTPIKTTLTLIEDETTRLCIISSHFIQEFYFETNLYRRRVAKTLGIPKANTFFFSSHNHTDACLALGQNEYGVPHYEACCSEDAL